jgi:hypothetical protein
MVRYRAMDRPPSQPLKRAKPLCFPQSIKRLDRIAFDLMQTFYALAQCVAERIHKIA